MFSAWERFSGVAWGGVEDQENEGVVAEEGFLAFDVSDMQRDDLLAAAPLEVTQEDDPEGPMASLPAEPAESEVRAEVSEVPLKEDFGPLPKYLSDYESIVLSAQDDGTRLAEDTSDNAIPPEPDPQFAEVGVDWKEHVVKAGETLSDIAMAFGGLTAQDILRANGLKDANRLSENQLLLIPKDADKIEETLEEVRTRQARVAALREKVEPLKVSSYVVAQGDSLWSISNSQNIELDTLVGSNVFKATLRPGQTLRIPNQEGIFYTLRKGEKIEAVCKRYGVELGKLRQVNHTVDVVALKPGDEIFLPGARPEALAVTHEEQPLKAEKSAPAVKNAVPKVAKNGKQKEAPVAMKASRSYRWPIMGRINSPFGWRRHPITRRQDFHTGIDIKASRGAVIRCARDGRVAYAGWMGGYGKVAVIEHAGGQSTLYAHCSTLLLKQGAAVKQGENIARVGTTGRSTGPHLHFEVRNGNSPVNPLKYLK